MGPGMEREFGEKLPLEVALKGLEQQFAQLALRPLLLDVICHLPQVAWWKSPSLMLLSCLSSFSQLLLVFTDQTVVFPALINHNSSRPAWNTQWVSYWCSWKLPEEVSDWRPFLYLAFITVVLFSYMFWLYFSAGYLRPR